MPIERLENLAAITSDKLTAQELRLIEAELLLKVLSARVNLNYQKTVLEFVREKLADTGEAPLLP
jgi:hypothetical protein